MNDKRQSGEPRRGWSSWFASQLETREVPIVAREAGPTHEMPKAAEAPPSTSEPEEFTVRGRNGQLTVTPSKIIIRREGAMGFLTQGHKGQKEIDLSQISSIQFKKNGIGTVGFIQFAFLGGREAKHGIRQAVNDENTILFAKSVEADFVHAKELIDRYRQRLRSPAPAEPQVVSPAAELEKFAQLHRDGVLTDEEFAAKKRQILGL